MRSRCAEHVHVPSRIQTRLLLVSLLAVLLTGPVSADPQRFYLVGQRDTASRGFLLDLRGNTLSSVPLTLTVGTGTLWRSLRATPGFQFDRDYQVHAVIMPSVAGLYVDGALLAGTRGEFAPASVPLEANYRPSWATDPPDWICIVTAASVSVTRNDAEVARHDFDTSASAARPVPLQFFEPGAYAQASLTVVPGDTVVLDVTMHFARTTLSPWVPFIDAYGQCTYADWPDKVRSDADLVADLAAEDAILATMPPSSDFDQYGGSLRAGWAEPATGFFRVTQHDGRWWFITPEGNPCFYLGLAKAPSSTSPTTPVTGRASLFAWLPPQEAPWDSVWEVDESWTASVALQGANLIRKYQYDPAWRQFAAARTITRMRAFGFSGGSKWDAPEGMARLPVLSRTDTPNLVNHPDVFDPAVRQAFRDNLAAQVVPHLGDPYIIGWSVGNGGDERIVGAEVTAILRLGAGVPAKRAFCDYALDTIYGGSFPALSSAWHIQATTRDQLYASTPAPPAGDVETLRLYYADRYYALGYDALKLIDPDHLVFSPHPCLACADRLADVPIMVRHCDVIAYQHYALSYSDDGWPELERSLGKPTFCGEFSFPPSYDGQRGFGRYTTFVRDDAEAGDKYVQWVQEATTSPYCVGVSYFNYRDQPLTGRGPVSDIPLIYGEHYAFGIITETDRVKWDLVTRMREANLQAVQWKLAAAEGLTADFSATGSVGQARLSVAFADASSGQPQTWSWDFGDGSTSAERNPTHEYAAPGDYTVSLTVSDEGQSMRTAKEHCVRAAFPDAPLTPAPGHWAADEIIACATRGIVQGYPDGNYGPEGPVTRAQMAVYLARALLGVTAPATLSDPGPSPSFSDVPEDSWAYRYVQYLASRGIVQGYVDGTYRPDLTVNRGQMAVFVARAQAAPAGDGAIPEGESVGTFPDVPGDAGQWSWCWKYVEYLVREGVVGGYPDGLYHPEATVTRAQMAVYVTRAFGLPVAD